MSSPVHDLALVANGLTRALFTAEEVADALAISKTLVRQLTLADDIPCRRIGRLVRYAPDDIAAFVRKRNDLGY